MATPIRNPAVQHLVDQADVNHTMARRSLGAYVSYKAEIARAKGRTVDRAAIVEALRKDVAGWLDQLEVSR